MACFFADVLYQVLTSKKDDYIFRKSKLLIKTIAKNGIIRRAAKKPVVEIYRFMYTEHCENTLRIEAI